jgi:hypothetical protein
MGRKGMRGRKVFKHVPESPGVVPRLVQHAWRSGRRRGTGRRRAVTGPLHLLAILHVFMHVLIARDFLAVKPRWLRQLAIALAAVCSA